MCDYGDDQELCYQLTDGTVEIIYLNFMLLFVTLIVQLILTNSASVICSTFVLSRVLILIMSLSVAVSISVSVLV